MDGASSSRRSSGSHTLGSAAVYAVRELQASSSLVDVELPHRGPAPGSRPAGQAFETWSRRCTPSTPSTLATSRAAPARSRKFDSLNRGAWAAASASGALWATTGPGGTNGSPSGLPPDLRRNCAGEGELSPPAGVQCPGRAGRPGRAPGPDRRRRRRARTSPGAPQTGPGRTQLGGNQGNAPRPGPDRLAVPFRDAETLGEELASYGPRVTVISPPELVAAVRRRPCAAAAAFAARPVPSVAFTAAGQAGSTRKRTSEDQLKRMLQLVRSSSTTRGCTSARSPPSLGSPARRFEIDLRILICSGLPEGYPDDLLDIQWDDDHVFITQGLDLTRPVRFAVDEACALLTGLETLNGLPELAEGKALESVTLKLMAAAREEGCQGGRVLSGPARWLPVTLPPLKRARAAIGPALPASPSVPLATARPRVRTRRGPPAALFAGQHLVPRGVLPLRPEACGTSGWTGSKPSSPTDARRPTRRSRPRASRRNCSPRTTTTPWWRWSSPRGAPVWRTTTTPSGRRPCPAAACSPKSGSAARTGCPCSSPSTAGMVRILQPEALADASREWLAAALTQYRRLTDGPID